MTLASKLGLQHSAVTGKPFALRGALARKLGRQGKEHLALLDLYQGSVKEEELIRKVASSASGESVVRLRSSESERRIVYLV